MSGVGEEGLKLTLAPVEEHIGYFKKQVEKQVKRVRLPIVAAMQSVKGIGPITVAEIITTLDIHKADYPSAFWKYVGYAGPSSERYEKGIKGGGNKHLRTVMYNAGMSLMKAKNVEYRAIYDRRKAKTEASERTTDHQVNGRREPVAWKDMQPEHRHMDALRVMNKLWLAHLWQVWREIEGLPTPGPYVQDHLGHQDISDPREYGWEW